MKRFGIFLFLITIFYSMVSAADKKIEKEAQEDMISIEELNSQYVKRDSLEKYKVIAEERLRQINDLNSRLDSKVNSAPTVNQFNDSIIQLKENIAGLCLKVDSLNGIIQNLNKDLAALDLIKVKFANSRLLIPYDSKRWKEAIDVFNSIVSPEEKEKYSAILTQLKLYPGSIDIVKDLISSIQYQGEPLTKFDDEQFLNWKNKAIKNIQSNAFYQNQKKSDIKILYLYNIIQEAEQRVNKAQGPLDIPDFSDMIIRLNLQ